MLITRLVSLPRRFQLQFMLKNNKLVAPKHTAAKKEDLVEDIDAPVKFSSSGARHWKARTTRMGTEYTRLWYEPYVIILSLSAFLIYFGILREENDIDEELSRSLYSRIEGLEEHQLRISLEYNREHNMDTSAIIKRLEELEAEKSNTEHNVS